jgi:hypothetical protein
VTFSAREVIVQGGGGSRSGGRHEL